MRDGPGLEMVHVRALQAIVRVEDGQGWILYEVRYIPGKVGRFRE